MNKILSKLSEVVRLLLDISKQLRDIQASQVRLEAEQKRQGAVLEEIRVAIVVEEAVDLGLTIGPVEEQP